MKIVRAVRQMYAETEERYKRLAKEVTLALKPKVEKNDWFFRSRIKSVESFALKIETGRVPDPGKMDDFLGCTIIVPTLSQVESAERLVTSAYELRQRKPPTDTRTHKPSSSFAFDDLRLYVARLPASSGRNADLEGLIFEVQIKTILQHAWGVATHDLIYKSNTVSWPLERIAYQVKAMLEHAEVAIAQASRLADSPAVAKKDDSTASVLKTIEELNKVWSEEALPNDVKRLAETIFSLLRAIGKDPNDLMSLIESEKSRVGLLPSDLSPYAFIVQALANSQQVDLKQKFKGKKLKLVIHSDMDLPDWMRNGTQRIINLG